MTIDDFILSIDTYLDDNISKYENKYVSNKEWLQIKEWLEQLKFLLEGEKTIYRVVYNGAIDEIRSKMIYFHANAIFRYGADILEARSDAFDDLECWIKKKMKEGAEC